MYITDAIITTRELQNISENSDTHNQDVNAACNNAQQKKMLASICLVTYFISCKFDCSVDNLAGQAHVVDLFY